MNFANFFILATETGAAGSTVGSSTANTATGTGGLLGSLAFPLLMVGFLALMYFFTIRPQRKKDKELKAQLEKIHVGDTVVTIGGLIGTVANIKDDNITVSTSVAHTMVTFKKSAISSVTQKEK